MWTIAPITKAMSSTDATTDPDRTLGIERLYKWADEEGRTMTWICQQVTRRYEGVSLSLNWLSQCRKGRRKGKRLNRQTVRALVHLTDGFVTEDQFIAPPGESLQPAQAS